MTRLAKAFEKELKKAHKEMSDLKREGLPTGEKCPDCEKELRLRTGRYGPFLACSGYPECKYTRDPKDDEGKEQNAETEEEAPTCPKCDSTLVRKRGRFGAFWACPEYPKCKHTQPMAAEKPEEVEGKCPQCGGGLMRRRGRYGPFTSCANYPECKFILKEVAAVACPDCGKPLARRRGKSRRSFWGCTGYPKCKYILWETPVDKACPECGHAFLVERKEGRACPRKGCGYVEERPQKTE